MEYIERINYKSDPGEWNDTPSLTIPGQTLTIAEMLTRIQNGQDIQLRNFEYLDGETPFPKIKDLTDVDEVNTYIQNTNNNYKQLELELEQKKKVKKEEANNVP